MPDPATAIIMPPLLLADVVVVVADELVTRWPTFYFELKKQGLFQELRSKPDPKEGKYKKRFGNPRY